jgi:hypothetical protein
MLRPSTVNCFRPLNCAGRSQIIREPFVLAIPELILAVHHGPHDAVAAVFVDYELKAAMAVTRASPASTSPDRGPHSRLQSGLSWRFPHCKMRVAPIEILP